MLQEHPVESNGSSTPSNREQVAEQVQNAAEPVRPAGPVALAIQLVRCPNCEYQWEHNCESLDMQVTCTSCGHTFLYVDGYLNNYKAHIEIFVDDVHPIPLVPGYSVGGEVTLPPNELVSVDFGIRYNKEPDVFFLMPGGKTLPELILNNQIAFPLSTSKTSVVFFTRTLAPEQDAHPLKLMWMAIGETGDYEKPLWLSYLQNAADLVRKEEELAAVVMLLIALDFFYDHILDRLGIDYPIIRRVGRRPGMNEKRAKLKLLSANLGDWPVEFGDHLKDLTDFRNRIVHGVVKRPEAPKVTARRGFQIVMRAVMILLEKYNRWLAQGPKELIVD